MGMIEGRMGAKSVSEKDEEGSDGSSCRCPSSLFLLLSLSSERRNGTFLQTIFYNFKPDCELFNQMKVSTVGWMRIHSLSFLSFFSLFPFIFLSFLSFFSLFPFIFLCLSFAFLSSESQCPTQKTRCNERKQVFPSFFSLYLVQY